MVGKRICAQKKMTDFDESFFNNLLHGVPASEQEQKLIDQKYSGFAPITEQVAQKHNWQITSFKRILHKEAQSLPRNLDEQKKIIDNIIEQWYTIYVHGMLGYTRDQLNALQKDPATRHTCTQSIPCGVQQLNVQVFWPPDEIENITGSRRHICCAQICQHKDKLQWHDRQHLAWSYDKLYGCETSGQLHHCIASSGNGCDGPLSKNQEGFAVCNISGLQYNCSLIHSTEDPNKATREKTGADVTHYSLEREVRAKEMRIITRIKETAKPTLGTAFPILTSEGTPADIPERNKLSSADEHSLLSLRHTYWDLFFGVNRVQKEMQNKVLMLMEISRNVGTLYQQAKPVLIGDLKKVVFKELKKESPYFQIIKEMDLIDRLRFVNYYALYCFFVWQFVVNNWDKVVTTRLQHDADRDVYVAASSATSTSKALITVKDSTQGQKGDLILLNCGLAVLRYIEAEHHTLRLIMPLLNIIEQFHFMANSSTFTLNTLMSYFSRVKQTKGLLLEQIVSIPTVPFDEIRRLPKPAKYDEVADAENIRKIMEASLQVKPGST